MNLAKAVTIHGFTTDQELAWLAEKASTCQMIAEIGSWKGRTARAMADNTSGTVYACDTFKGTKEDRHFQELIGKDADYLWNEFLANTRECGNLIPLRMASLEGADYCSRHNLSFDLIFVDAAHDYSNVKADILAWRPLLKDGGLFCGHDFDGGRPGVVKAVRELIANPRKVGVGSIWMAG